MKVMNIVRLQAVLPVFTLMLGLLSAMPFRAAEAVRLPICFNGQWETVVSYTTASFNGRTYQAAEVQDVATSGHIYWISAANALLLDNVKVDKLLGTQTFISFRTPTTVMHVWVKGNCSLASKGITLQSLGTLMITGEGVGKSALTVESGSEALVSNGNVTVKNVSITTDSKSHAVEMTSENRNLQATLLVSYAALQCKNYGIKGFTNLVTEGCGLSAETYQGKNAKYDKKERALFLGSSLSKGLSVVTTGDYYAVDTRKTVANGTYIIENGVLHESAATLAKATPPTDVTMPFAIGSLKKPTLAKGHYIGIAGKRVMAYELTNVPGLSNGHVYYAPDSQMLILKDAVIAVTGSDPCLTFTAEASLGVLGRCIIRAERVAVLAKNQLQVVGQSPTESSLTAYAQGSVAWSAGGKLTMENLTLQIDRAEYALAGITPFDMKLELTNVKGSLFASSNVVANFKTVTLKGCGPASLNHTAGSMVYDYERRRMLLNKQDAPRMLLDNSRYVALKLQGQNSGTGSSANGTSRPSASSASLSKATEGSSKGTSVRQSADGGRSTARPASKRASSSSRK